MGRRLLVLLVVLIAAAPAWAGEGRVSGFAFEHGSGAPLVGLRVEGPETSTHTGRQGHFALRLPEGEHTLRIHAPGGPWPVEVAVVADRTSEVLLTVDSDRALLHAEVEEPAAAGRSAPEAVATGEVQGVVTSHDDGAPVAGARVFVRGTPARAETDGEGRFRLQVPVGTWDLSVLRSGFATQAVPGVEVREDEVVPVEITLVPAGLELADYTISAPAVTGGSAMLLDERRSAGAVADVLGAEQMSRAGDSDAAAALKRVTGLTLVGGKYIYVRGLGERYSATLLNGAHLPSPEPERRVVPLDMFPTGVLESVVIQKTATPDMPAEFGGGTILLRTRSVPYEPLLKVGVSTGGNTATTFGRGLRGAGGPTDFLGIDGGYRALPDAVAEASAKSPLEEGDMFSERGYTASELEGFGEAIRSDRWGMREATIPPDLGASVTVGNGTDRGPWALGALASMMYSSDWDTDVFERDYFLLGAGDQLERGHHYTFDQTTHEVGLGGMLQLGAERPGEHELGLTTLISRNTDDTARLYEGFNRDLGGTLRIGRIRWEERMLVTNQARGTHFLPAGLRTDWRYTFSWASRLEPDRRDYRRDYEEGADAWYLSDRPEGNQIFHSELRDLHHDLGVDLTVPFGPDREAEGAPSLKVGASAVIRDREVDTRRFKYFHKGPRSRADDVLTRPVEDVFTDQTIGPDGFQFEEFTRQTDNYAATQRLLAGYAMVDLPLGDAIRVVGGARLERSSQGVRTFELFNPDDEPVVADLGTLDVLPSLVATWRLPHDMQLRGGYGRTLSRPDFRELSPATFNDVTGGRMVFGNAELGRATIDNLDLRWEWFPVQGDVIAGSVFYKQFTDPIEQIVVVSAQHSVTYDNADGARSLGLELELRKQLDFLGAPLLEDVFVAGNASWIRSRVALPEDQGIQTSDHRPLQGQSPWVYNAQVGYHDPASELSATLLYHVFGPRIVEVGALGAPDTMELPVHQVDLVASGPAWGGLRWTLKAKNLANPPIAQTMGERVTKRLHEGFAFSAGLSWER